jgi:dTDP-4-amino-4,6-dideoxygalactose transaminase
MVDVDDDTFNIDPESLKRAITTAKSLKLKPRAVIPVDLFGLPVDFDAIDVIAKAEGLRVLDDAAQGFGASYKNRKVGVLSHATATSFYPSMPLGCFGDGGAIFTDDDDLAATLRSLHVHGEGTSRYDNVRIGINSRLDTLQAAILIEKLKIFPEEIAARDKAAAYYSQALRDSVTVPAVPADRTSVWAQYTIRISGGRRDKLAAALKARGVPTAIHYARPLHHQPAYKDYPVAAGGLPVSEKLAGEVLSLPMHPYLRADVQNRIIGAVRDGLAG